MVAPLPFSTDAIRSFCQRWGVTELSLFGSVLRDDFRVDSDVDVLVVFAPEVDHSIEDWIRMEDELRVVFGREIDLVEKSTIDNPFRRHHILTHRRIVYAA